MTCPECNKEVLNIPGNGYNYTYTCSKCGIVFKWNHRRKTKQIIDVLRKEVKDDFFLESIDREGYDYNEE